MSYVMSILRSLLIFWLSIDFFKERSVFKQYVLTLVITYIYTQYIECMPQMELNVFDANPSHRIIMDESTYHWILVKGRPLLLN